MQGWARTARVAGLAIVMLTAVAPRAGAASGSEDCPDREMSRTFGWALDPNLYFPMPGGDFEAGADGWELRGGASVVDGSSQTLMPSSSNHSHALSMPAGSTAKAEPLCVEGTATVMRFFARSRGLAGAAVVTVTARGESGATQTLISPVLTLTGAWTSPVALFRLPLLGDGLTSVTIQIRAIGLGGIEVDDIHIDPLRQR